MAEDMTTDASAVQRAVFAGMTGGERVAAAMEMSESAKQVALAGIRSRHPEFDELQVKRAWFVRLHGEPLTEAILGPCTTGV